MVVEGDPSDHDFNNDVRWRRFASSLKDKGYFRVRFIVVSYLYIYSNSLISKLIFIAIIYIQGEIEGSKLHQQLMLQAKDFYISSLKKDTNGNINPGMRIKSLLGSLSVNYEEMKEEEKSLRPEDGKLCI